MISVHTYGICPQLQFNSWAVLTCFLPDFNFNYIRSLSLCVCVCVCVRVCVRARAHARGNKVGLIAEVRARLLHGTLEPMYNFDIMCNQSRRPLQPYATPRAACPILYNTTCSR